MRYAVTPAKDNKVNLKCFLMLHGHSSRIEETDALRAVAWSPPGSIWSQAAWDEALGAVSLAARIEQPESYETRREFFHLTFFSDFGKVTRSTLPTSCPMTSRSSEENAAIPSTPKTRSDISRKDSTRTGLVDASG